MVFVVFVVFVVTLNWQKDSQQHMDEYLDIYDREGFPLGVTRPKQEVHVRGDWHRTFHCWIAYRDAAQHDHLLMQRRAATKDIFADRLDVTAAGHIQSGEGVDGGLREIQEELGITVPASRLHFLGERVWQDESHPHIINREFQQVYILVDDRPLAHYRIDPGEVAALVDLALSDVAALLAGQVPQITGRALLGSFVGEVAITEQYTVRRSDCVPAPDDYLRRVVQAVQKLLAGAEHRTL